MYNKHKLVNTLNTCALCRLLIIYACVFVVVPDDFDHDIAPGKLEDTFCGTYTFTTAKILHPTDEYDACTSTTSM